MCFQNDGISDGGSTSFRGSALGVVVRYGWVHSHFTDNHVKIVFPIEYPSIEVLLVEV